MTDERLGTKARTLNEPVRPLVPQRVILPLQQRSGPPCRPTVEIGRRVRVGELVAASEPGSGMDLRIHASVAGVIVSVSDRSASHGTIEDAIIIEGDHSQEQKPDSSLVDVTPDAIRTAVREAGIVGLGGAGFPTYVKLEVPSGNTIDSVIVNGCECEPYLTGDHRVLIEQPEEVIDGLNLIRMAVGAERGHIATGIESKDATRNIDPLLDSKNGNRVVHLDHERALGYEKTLVCAVLGRVVPHGKLPRDVGVIVQNVQTTIAVSQAVRQRKALTSRVITVSGGAVTRPGNYRVPIGTSVRTILETCCWEPQETDAIVMGGPMMGVPVEHLDTPIRKSTTAVVAMTSAEIAPFMNAPCIRCGTCAEVCPLGLVPVDIARSCGAPPSALQSLAVDHCVECGECEYVCPSGRPLLDKIRVAKSILNEQESTGT